ncbi:type II RES/Xre toxin-antitoxin system antitoxin [Rhodohalobacter sp. 8-1]|uniref:type II RES/Xre toxin-antitoxin system antitoxin n=1 Tax=Rhodohalobacter sp. 8-1 TaxID=3131972 RepID=UPI0030EB9908
MSHSYQEKTGKPLTVQETAVKYQVSATNEFETAKHARTGLSVSAFFDLIDVSGLSNQELSSILDLSFKTIQRYQKEGKKLNAMNSEQLLKLIGLYQKAEEVFGDIGSFNRWLRKPAAGLENEHPFTFLQTSGGIDLVRDELLRIEYGALA